MNRYLLDTNICIHFLKGQYGLAEKIKNVGPLSCYISEITIAELLFGVANSSESQRQNNRRNAQEFLNSFSGRTLLIGDCFYEYARQKYNLRKIGRTVG